MSQFDFKQYYLEQDEHTNLAEETIDEYLKRTASYRRSQISDAYASSSRMQRGSSLWAENPRNVPIPDVVPDTIALASHGVNFPPANHGTSEKRKASDSLESAEQKKVMVEQARDRAITPEQGEMLLMPAHPQAKSPISKSDAEHVSSSPSLEDIDSFTIDLCYEKLSPSQQQSGKRKLIQVSTNAPHTAHKKRRINLARSPQMPATQQSPISSFSASTVHSPKKVRAVQRNEEGPSVPRRVVLLHMVPQVLQKQIKPAKMVSEPPTSPIEDPSSVIDDNPPPQSSVNPKRLEDTPSVIFLGIQERLSKKLPEKPSQASKVGSKQATGKASSSKKTSVPTQKSTSAHVSSFPFSRGESHNDKTGEQITLNPIAKPCKGRELAAQKKTKAVRQSMTGAECARKVLTDAASKVIKVKKRQPLSGTNILYVGADAISATRNTENKMIKIVVNGGNLMPEFDPDVTTHIISVENDRKGVLKATGLSGLRDIPDKIQTVTWRWAEEVIDSSSPEEISERLLETWKYPSFSFRLKSTPMTSLKGFKDFNRLQKPKEPQPTKSGSPSRPDSSTISIPSGSHQPEPLLSPPTSPVRLMQPGNVEIDKLDDPLAEFYDQAREQKQLEEGWSSSGELNMMENPDRDESDGSEPEEVNSMPRKKRAWACDAKEPKTDTQSPNQDIIDKLTELRNIHEAKVGNEHRWRVFALNKAIRALRGHTRRVKGFEDANRIPGIGEKTARKIAEIVETGGLRRIVYENSEDVQVTRLFQGIYGVGQTIALQWYSAGCRTLEDVKAGKGGVKLSAVQRIGLQFYDDINDRMPRAEAKQIYDLIKTIVLSIDSQLFIEIMGSYRRGKADCGDIDILISRSTHDGSTHRGVLSRLLRELHKTGILTEDLALPDDPHDLEATYRGLCHLPGVKDAKRRRIDILTVPWTSKGAALLYYTGDDMFNRAIRLKANVMGYSLNQTGLFANVIRDPRDRRIKMNNGRIVASETEEDIFKILGVPWQEPHERVRA